MNRWMDNMNRRMVGMNRWMADMNRRMAAVALLTLATLAGSAPASAFAPAAMGPVVGAVDPDGVEGAFSIGAEVSLEQPGSAVHLEPNLLYWSENGLSDVNPNFDVSYHFLPSSQVSPYVGAGAGLHFYSSDGPDDPGTDPGANFFVGVTLPAQSMRFFFEGRVAATDRTQAGILAGAMFYLGR